MQNDFTITKDNLGNTDAVATMTLENSDYKVKLYYMGDFYGDKARKGLNPHKLAIPIRPKGGAPSMTMVGMEPYVNDPELIMFPARDIDGTIQMLAKAAGSARMLKAAVAEICGPIRDWDETVGEE